MRPSFGPLHSTQWQRVVHSHVLTSLFVYTGNKTLCTSLRAQNSSLELTINDVWQPLRLATLLLQLRLATFQINQSVMWSENLDRLRVELRTEKTVHVLHGSKGDFLIYLFIYFT